MKKYKLFTQRNLLITLFIIFLFVRIFVDKPSILVGADKFKFLETAKRFPHHTLYNNQLYLLHPPFYPYTIHFFNLIFKEDYIAGIFVSLASSIVTFFIIYRLFMMLTNSFNITYFILVFFTLSESLIKASTLILRESYVVMLVFLALYLYIKGIKFNDKKSIVIASIAGSLLAITSDHVVFVIPAFVLSYLFFNREKADVLKFYFPKLTYIIIPLLLMGLVYGFWTGIKFYQYSKYEYYPNGYSGMPVSTHDLGLLQAISPQLFEDYSGPKMGSGLVATVKRVVFNMGYMFNMQPFSIPGGLNFTTMGFLLRPIHVGYMIAIYLPLALIALYGFVLILKELAKNTKIYNNVSLYMLLLFLIFLFPITQRFTGPRYLYIAYFFLFYIISYGLINLLKKIGAPQIRFRIIPAITILLLLLTPFWFYHNNHFVLFISKVAKDQNTANFINSNLPKDAGIMAQPGYNVDLIYQTGNRMVALYYKPENLPALIDYYNISYIVFGRFFTDYYHLSEASVEFVRNNPSMFELIATIQEDYSDFYTEGDHARTDEVYIYKVIK